MPAALVLKIDNFKPYSACEYCLPILNAPPVRVECSMFTQGEYTTIYYSRKNAYNLWCW